MKLEITEQGVFASSGEKGKAEQEVPIGTEIEIRGEAVPSSLIGKCRVIGEKPAKATAITNNADKRPAG